MAEKIIEARAVISAEDRTGQKFERIGRKIDNLVGHAKRIDTVAGSFRGIAPAIDRFGAAMGQADRRARQLERTNRRVARSFATVEQAVHRAHRLVGHAAGGYLAYEATRHAGRAAANYQREKVSMANAGMTPQEIARAEAQALKIGKDIPSID